jgi:hypothetical protein
MKKSIRKMAKKILLKFIPEFHKVLNEDNNFQYIRNKCSDSKISSLSRIFGPYSVSKIELGDYSYIGQYAIVNLTNI